MQITIRNQPQDIEVQTISVSHDKKHPGNVYLFRCHRCSSPVNQVQGTISGIFPGLMPTNEVVTINKCPTCRELYTFQTHDKDVNYTRVVLSIKNNINTFHCWLCRNQLIQFNDHIVTLLPTHLQVELPYKVDCIDKTCGRKYNIVDLV